MTPVPATRPWPPYVLPFAAYMGFIALEGLLETAAGALPALAALAAADHLWLYPLKVGVVVLLLWRFRHRYAEFRAPARPGRDWPLAVAVGTAVFLLWIRMDWPFATQGGAEGYDPHAAALGAAAALPLIAIRLAGAALVVPVFEELFWRAFVMRYLVRPDFHNVPLGAFTPASFAITAVLFGLEHHLWLAGIMAGAAYGALLCVTRNLPVVIVAHGVTNLLLGVWVLATANWAFW
ncbi:MAG: CAAX prenyl protease-related protein [Nitrospirae bacterium]|nr:CAAX prenyl protease-related protein [Nitrospirota bacterium]